MSKYTVSVWMITYNHAKYIREALESVLCQIVDFKYEIVIGDDFSTDGTREILLDYKTKYPDIIKLLFHKKNIGMIANQNKTFDGCSGDFIAMLEGDDYWISPNKLQIQVDLMKQFSQCYMSFHPVRETLYNGVLTRQEKDLKIVSVEDIIKGGGYFCSTPSLMIKRSVVQDMPIFLEKAPAGDYYLQILGSLNGGALYVDKVMATYRIQSEGSWSESMKSLSNKINFINQTILILRELNIFLKYRYTEAISHRISNIYLTRALSYLVNGYYCEFRNSLTLSDKEYKLNSAKYKFVSFFRFYPKIIIIIVSSRKIILRMQGILSKFFRG